MHSVGLFCKDDLMAITPIVPITESEIRPRILGRIRLFVLFALLGLLVLCLAFSWTTRDAMEHLHFLRSQGAGGLSGSKKPLVDLRVWQTAQALAPLAVTQEETEYASEAERLADHAVDQAFAAALRIAGLKAESGALTAEALALTQKVEQLKQLIKQDQALILSLTPHPSAVASLKVKDDSPNGGEDDLEVAKAQLGLDSDELADAQHNLELATDSDSAKIQDELTAHEAAMKEYDSKSKNTGQIAILSAKQNGTLARRIQVWFSQRDRSQLLQQALQETQADIAALTAARQSFEAKVSTAKAISANGSGGRVAKLANLAAQSREHQILTIEEDRILTEQQLATIYGKWSTQLLLQHRIVLHMILQSLALIVFIALCMVLFDALVRRVVASPTLDRRQSQTLRRIFELGVQFLGTVLILLVIFGIPQQMPTILGLATAALTIALQDFILAFLGWFVLMGKNGIHVGDWVQINSVCGEVTEVGLFSTTLLETGDQAKQEHLTGRRISFINSYAIRGQFFNFSTASQWTWDEISVNMPATVDIQSATEKIHKAVVAETEADSQIAEREWNREASGDVHRSFNATPVISLRPSSSGIEIDVRYVTRASQRVAVRNRLNQQFIELLHQKPVETAAGGA